MPSVEYDLKFLQVGLVDLEGYLLSNEIYWPVIAASPAGEPPYPRLTLGSLLLAAERLKARSLEPEQEQQFRQANTRLDDAHTSWRVAWEKKAEQEFGARLALWRNFLEDYREEPDANADRYDYEVNRRVMLELLSRQTGSLPAQEAELLSGLDGLLRAVFEPCEFIWDPDLKDAFPPEPYWFLYGRPQETR